MSLLDYDGSAPEEREDYSDFSNPLNVLRAPSWISAAPEKRAGLVDRAMTAFLGDLEAKKDKSIKFTRPDGQEVDAPVWGADGTLTKQGEEYVSRARSLFQTAAQDPDGGLYRDEYTGRVETSPWLDNVINAKPEKQVDPLTDYQPWFEERQKLATEDETAKLSWEDYVDFANSDINAEEAKIDVNDKRLKNEWARRTALSTFSPDQLGEDEIGRVVGGQMVINPRHYSEIDKVEEWINGQEKFSASEKKLNLLEYRKKIEQNAGELVNQFSAADAGVLMSIGSSPLRDEFMEAASKPGFSAYQFLKDNKERFSKDSYGIGSEVATKFRDAIMATGTGALFLAGKAADAVGADGVRDVLSAPAEAWGGLAEDSAAGFSNGEAFSIGGIEVTRRDLTELTGQVGSFFAMGGLGSLATKGLVKAGVMKAPQAASVVGAEAALTKTLGEKALGLGKAMVTDATAYAGGAQAAGMSFGRTFDQQMKLHGNRDKAYAEASIEGLSDALSATIATGVMNRFGMGMEKVMDAGEAAVGGGLVQRIRTGVLSKQGIKDVQETLAKLKSPELTKAFGTEIAKSMNQMAKANGLKGLGVVGDVLSEGVEESMDELLSTVFTAIQKDSETWTEESWKNISQNWKQYVKAGILGAIGGSAGGAVNAVRHPLDTFGKSDGLKAMEAEWVLIKQNVAKFEDNARMVATDGKVVSVAEMLASKMDADPVKDIQRKAEILTNAALGFGLHKDAAFSLLQKASPSASNTAAAPSASPPAATPSSAATAPANGKPEDSLPALMAHVNIDPIPGKEWDDQVKVEVASSGEKLVMKTAGKTAMLYPINAVGDGARGTKMMAVKIVETANDGTSQERIVGIDEAAAYMDQNGFSKKRASFLGDPASESLETKQADYEQWSKEQSTGSDGNSGQEPAASQAGSGNTGTPKGNSNSPAPSNVSPVTPRQSKAPLSRERVAELIALGSQPLPGSDSPAARARSAAITELKDNSLWDDAAKKPSAEAMALATAKPKASLPSEGVDHSSKISKIANGHYRVETKSGFSEIKLSPKEDSKASAMADDLAIKTWPDLVTAKESQAATKAASKPNQETNENQDKTETPTGDEEGLLTSPEPSEEAPPVASDESRLQDALKNVRGYLRSTNQAGKVTDEEITKALKSNGALSKTKSKWVAAALSTLRQSHSSLQAAPVENAPESVAGLDPESTYIIEQDALQNGTDKAGGQWRATTSENGKKQYVYTPPEGFTSTIGAGDVIVVAGPKGRNQTTYLIARPDESGGIIQDGSMVFEEIPLITDTQSKTNAGLREASERYTRSMLNSLTPEIIPFLKKIKGKTLGAEEAKEMERIFKKARTIVLPKLNAKVKNTKLPEGVFIEARPAGKDSADGDVIAVDYAKLAAEMQKLYAHSDTGNEFAQELLALDFSSFLATVMSEEGIHIVTFNAFKPQEIIAFYNDFANLNAEYREEQEAKGKEVKNHPLYEELVVRTAQQRKITANLDPNADDALTPQEMHSIAAEVMRKAVQMSMTGTTTERQGRLSYMLQSAIIADEGVAKQKGQVSPEGKGVTKYLKAIAHMIRRYADRMRTILWISWHRGMLPSNLQAPLQRLIEATKQSGMNVDVFGAHGDTLRSQTRLEAEYEKNLRKDLEQVARSHSHPLKQLRQWVQRDSTYAMEEVLIHDPQTMELRLHPDIQARLEKTGEVDVEALQKQLDQFNGKGDVMGRAPTSLRRAKTSAFLKWQKMNLLRDALPARFAAADLWTGAMNTDREGITRPDRDKLITELFTGLDESVTTEEAMVDIQQLHDVAMAEVEQSARDARVAQKAFYDHAKKELVGLDLGSAEGMRKLSEWSAVLGVPLSQTTQTFTTASDVESRRTFAELGEDEVDPSIEIEAARVQMLQRLGMWLTPMAGNWANRPPAKKLTGESKRLFNEFVGRVDVTEQARLSANQAMKNRAEAVRNRGKASKVQTKASIDDYVAVVDFTRAVDDYNNALKNLTSRAIGSFGVRTTGFGTVMSDTLQPTGSGESVRYLSSTATLEPVVVDFGDAGRLREIGSSVVFPEEHGVLNTASPASRPFAYSSSFIYPQAETGNLVFNEATAQAEFAGKGRRRKQGELTEDEQRWNDELGRYRTQTESNFFYVGRTSWADFWIEQMMGQVRDPAAIKQYRETAGFDFDKTIHPEDDSVRYEKWWEAVPDFDHQEIGQALRALAGLKDMRPEAALEKIAHVFETLEKARAWSEKLRGLYQGSGFVPQLGKMQTLAGRLAPLLDFALGREDEGGYLSRGLDDTLNAVYKELTAKVSGLVRVQPAGVVRGHQSSLNPIIYGADGKPSYVQAFGSHDQSTAQKNLGENIYNSLAPGKPLYEELKTSVYEAAQAARLVRIGVKTFMDRKWRENVEHEGTRTITDPAYEPEYEPLNKLRDNSLNPRVLQNLSFITTYMQKQRGYWFSPNTGTEMLAEYNNLNFGEGYEPFTKPQIGVETRNASEQESFDFAENGEKVRMQRSRRPSTSQESFDFAEAGFVKGEITDFDTGSANYTVSRQVVKPRNTFDTVYDPNRDPYNGDDWRVMGGNMGALGSDLAGWNETGDGKVSTQAETAARKAGALDVARGYRDAKWALLLGSNTNQGFNGDAGMSFYYDLLQAEENNQVSVEDVIKERERFGSEATPKRLQTQTIDAIMDEGPFGEEIVISEGTPVTSPVGLRKAELRQMDQAQLQAYFRQALVKSLVLRGLQGIFPDMPFNRKPEFKEAVMSEFLAEFGDDSGNAFRSEVDANGDPVSIPIDTEPSYTFTTVEEFMHNLAEFKAGFERKVVDRSIVKEQSAITLALETVIGSVDLDTAVEDASFSWTKAKDKSHTDALKSFADELKSQRQGIFEEAPSTAVSAIDAANIWKLVRAEAEKPSVRIVKDKLGNVKQTIVLGKVLDVSQMQMLNSTVGAQLEHLLLNLPGQTAVVIADSKMATRHGLSDTGIRIFEGRRGEKGKKDLPNVIYLPLMEGQRNTRQQGEIEMAAAQALKMIAKSNPAVTEMVSDLAGKINTALDPVIRAEAIFQKLNPEGQWLHNKTDLFQFADTTEAIAARGEAIDAALAQVLAGVPIELDDKARSDVRSLVKAQFLKSVRLAQELGIGRLTKAQIGLFGEQDNFNNDVLLVAKMLSDPKAKQLFDQAYFGSEALKLTTLNPLIVADVTSGIMDLAKSGEVEGPRMDADWTDGEQRAEGAEEDDFDQADQANKEELASGYEQNREEEFERQERQLEDLEEADEDSLFEVGTGASDDVRARIRAIVRKAANGQAVYVGPASIFSDADIALVNGLLGIVSSAQQARSGLKPMDFNRGAREMLKAPLTKEGERGRIDRERTGYMIGSERYTDSAGIYVGEWKNAGRPTLPGNRTALNNAFYDTRIGRMMASVSQLSPELRAKTVEAARLAIQQQIMDKARRLAENGELDDYDFDDWKRFTRENIELELTDRAIAELGKVLPAGMLEQAQAEVDAELARLEDAFEAGERNKADIKQEMLEAKKAIVRGSWNEYEARIGLLNSFIASRENLIKDNKELIAEMPESPLKDRLKKKNSVLLNEVEAMSSRVKSMRKDSGTKPVKRPDRASVMRKFSEEVASIVRDVLSAETGKVGNMSRLFVSVLRAKMETPEIAQAIQESRASLDEIGRLVARRERIKQAEESGDTDFFAGAIESDMRVDRIDERISNLVRSYNASVETLNLELSVLSRKALRLLGYKGKVNGFAVRELPLNVETVPTSGQIIKARRSLFGMDNFSLTKVNLNRAAVNTISDNFQKQLSEALGSKKSGGYELSSEYQAFIAKLREVVQDTEPDQLGDVVMSALEGLAQSATKPESLMKFLEESYMTVAEEMALHERPGVSEEMGDYLAMGQTSSQRDEILRHTIRLNYINDQLRGVRSALAKIDATGYAEPLGNFFYRGEAGSEPLGSILPDGVDKTMREIPLELSFVAEGMKVGQAGLAGRNAWMGLEGVAEGSVDEGKEEALKARRRAFWRQKEGIVRALRTFADERLEDSYRMARNTDENFVEFDQLKTIEQAVEMARIESALMDYRFSQAKDEAAMAGYRGMSNQALALLTDPDDKLGMEALTRSEKNALRKMKMPKDVNERTERLGQYFEQEGMGMILLPTTARDEMMRAFPGQVTRRNVNSVLEHSALRAVSPNTQAAPKAEDSYFFQEVNENTDKLFKKPFSHEDKDTSKNRKWRLADETMTRAEAADAFANEWEKRITQWLKNARNINSKSPDRKQLKLDGDLTKAQIESYKNLIRQIVLAYGGGHLDGHIYARNEVRDFLMMIDSLGEGGFDHVSLVSGKFNFDSMEKFKVEPIFSKVFSAIESEQLMRRLVSGMTMPAKDSTDLVMMRLAHHHDARIRNRFRKSLVARQAARHLFAFIDHGIDGQSGREGYITAKDRVKKTIGESADKVGSSAKNHAIGYLLAQVRGIRDANGSSLSYAYTGWMRQFRHGYQQSKEFTNAQKQAYSSQKAGIKGKIGDTFGDISRYWSGGHVDLVRDQALADEMWKIVQGIQGLKVDTRGNDTDAEAMIQMIEKALRDAVEDSKGQEVDDYANVLQEQFADLDTAMHLSLAMTSKPGLDVQGTEEKTKWKHQQIKAHRETFSTVPMRLGYAKKPKSRERGVEGRFITDPIELVSMDESAFFGGIAKGEPFEKTNVYRPIMINGLSTPLSIMDDSIYRLNVTPTYEVLRRAVGKVRATHGPLEITESDIVQVLDSNTLDEDALSMDSKFNHARYGYVKEAKSALAAIAYELETILQNDSQIGTDNTGGAEVMRFLGAQHIVRSLASPLQWWDQGASPSIGYSVGKLVAGKPKSAALYWQTLGRMLTSSDFRNRVKEFIKNVSPYVYYRASDGQDVAEDVMRKQERYGQGTAKAKTGKALRKYERFAEKSLSWTIGAPERILAGTIFMVELSEKMGGIPVESVLENEKRIDRGIAQDAKLKVNDVMAQSDQAKKGYFFQTRDQNPVRNALWRSMVRFSNHTASMGSNSAVMSRVLFTNGRQDADEFGNYGVSADDAEQSRREAAENLATTLTQNILFYPMKLKVLLPLVLSLAYVLGGDDDDEATRKAQKTADKLISPDENANMAHRFLMRLLFGKERQLFSEDKKPDEAQASAVAEILNKSAQEMLTTIPYVGVAFGYSPVNGIVDRMLTNDMSEEIVASAMDVKRGNVRIRQYDPGFIERSAEAMAPTAAAYDYAAALKLAVDYQMTNKAGQDRPVSLMNMALYLALEATPLTREPRSHMKGILEEPVKLEELRKSRR